MGKPVLNFKKIFRILLGIDRATTFVKNFGALLRFLDTFKLEGGNVPFLCAPAGRICIGRVGLNTKYSGALCAHWKF